MWYYCVYKFHILSLQWHCLFLIPIPDPPQKNVSSWLKKPPDPWQIGSKFKERLFHPIEDHPWQSVAIKDILLLPSFWKLIINWCSFTPNMMMLCCGLGTTPVIWDGWSEEITDWLIYNKLCQSWASSSNSQNN